MGIKYEFNVDESMPYFCTNETYVEREDSNNIRALNDTISKALL